MSGEKRKRPRITVRPGLVENQNADGSLTYTSTVYYGEPKPSVRPFKNVTRTHAKELHIEHEHEVKNEGYRPARGDVTFRQLQEFCFAHYEKEIAAHGREIAGMTERTLGNYKTALRRFPDTDPIWNAKLSKLDSAVALKFLIRLRRLHRSDENPSGRYEWKTLNETFSAVRTIFRYGLEENFLRVDPYAYIPRKYRIPQTANEKNVKQALAPWQLRAIIEAALSEEFVEATDNLYSNAVIQAFSEGERIGETRLAHWRDVDNTFGILTTRGTKNARSKKRPQAAQKVTAEAWARQLKYELEKGFGRPDDYVYTRDDGSGEPFTKDELRLAVERAGRLAGLGHITPMNGRKSIVTADRLAGVDPQRAADKAGHTVGVADAHYVSPPHDLEALSRDRDLRAAYLGLNPVPSLYRGPEEEQA